MYFPVSCVIAKQSTQIKLISTISFAMVECRCRFQFKFNSHPIMKLSILCMIFITIHQSICSEKIGPFICAYQECDATNSSQCLVLSNSTTFELRLQCKCKQEGFIRVGSKCVRAISAGLWQKGGAVILLAALVGFVLFGCALRGVLVLWYSRKTSKVPKLTLA